MNAKLQGNTYEPDAKRVGEFKKQIVEAFTRARIKGKGSISELAVATGINRKKLAAIENGVDCFNSFTTADLLALDALLDGELVAALRGLRATSMAQVLAQASAMTFLIGARELDKTDHVSRWDVRAMTALLRAVQRHAHRLPEFDVEDVLGNARLGRKKSGYEIAIRNESWFRRLQELSPRVLVVLGSPRACHPSEHVLCEMFGQKPYSKPTSSIPFRFLWTQGLYARVPSTFAKVVPADRSMGATKAIKSEILGVEFGGREYRIAPTSSTWNTYGFCAAQRRRTGQTWIVTAGATGPATYATALALGFANDALPAPTLENEGAPVWFAVEAEVGCDPDRPGDNRRYCNARIIRNADGGTGPAIASRMDSQEASLLQETRAGGGH